MHRLIPLWMVVLIWVTPAMAQTPDYIIQNNAAPMKSLGAQAEQPVKSSAVPLAARTAAPAASRNDAKIRIAVLLPNDSPSLKEAAAVVQRGVETAAATDANAELVVVSESEDTVVSRYREAVAAGADVVIGPLSRSAIASVAPYVSVPTLALNSVNREVLGNAKLYSLSLVVEGEAQQIAKLMAQDGRTRPLLLVGEDALSRRLEQAFLDEWQRRYPNKRPVSLEVTSGREDAVLIAAESADAVFMAVNAQEAGKLKQGLNPELPVYGTSQLNSHHVGPELAGVRIIDMPWFLMPEHDAVKHYPKPAAALTMQTERLYALGIDAWRLAVLLAGKGKVSSLRLDGVSGDLKLGEGRVFERELPVKVLGAGELQ
ncbi:penicillin-binding protein activator [Neisseriaceae bacterium TC5R-5]|nr:penicillin-binding protein activator [Neisseriaceae bacterium TC5R-5]